MPTKVEGREDEDGLIRMVTAINGCLLVGVIHIMVIFLCALRLVKIIWPLSNVFFWGIDVYSAFMPTALPGFRLLKAIR